MEKEHTPAEPTLARTAYRFTKAETIQALAEYVVKYGHGPIPEGTMIVVLPRTLDDWAASLCVTHPDPPLAREDADDE